MGSISCKPRFIFPLRNPSCPFLSNFKHSYIPHPDELGRDLGRVGKLVQRATRWYKLVRPTIWQKKLQSLQKITMATLLLHLDLPHFVEIWASRPWWLSVCNSNRSTNKKNWSNCHWKHFVCTVTLRFWETTIGNSDNHHTSEWWWTYHNNRLLSPW